MKLTAYDVTVTFPGKTEPVLVDANFECQTGDTVAILGPSGSGKSTLLSVLGGLLRPDSGVVTVIENDDAFSSNTSIPVEQLRAASSWILQTTNVLPERTAIDNVAIAAQLAGVGRAEAIDRAWDALGLVGLHSRADARAGVLSGGEVQRVVTARALVAGRPFILADEPTGQLDRSATNVVLDALFASVTEAARADRTGLVVVTHDPVVASRCDRIVHIDDGRVVADPGLESAELADQEFGEKCR